MKTTILYLFASAIGTYVGFYAGQRDTRDEAVRVGVAEWVNGGETFQWKEAP